MNTYIKLQQPTPTTKPTVNYDEMRRRREERRREVAEILRKNREHPD
ncbi:MAG: hypothetical protein ABSG53_15455 [Thermoguttaceae bacterium]|jgi:hypothetical protein